MGTYNIIYHLPMVQSVIIGYRSGTRVAWGIGTTLRGHPQICFLGKPNNTIPSAMHALRPSAGAEAPTRSGSSQQTRSAYPLLVWVPATAPSLTPPYGMPLPLPLSTNQNRLPCRTLRRSTHVRQAPSWQLAPPMHIAVLPLAVPITRIYHPIDQSG